MVRWCVYLTALIVAAAFEAAPVFAQSGLEGCGNLIGKSVRTELVKDSDFVAQVAGPDDQKAYHISVNPFTFNLGGETVSWFYFRQCALIERYGENAAKQLEPAEVSFADCRAVQLMQNDPNQSPFSLRVIARDLDVLQKTGPWPRDLGEKRRINIENCL
jgi:hypothetical protein